MWILGNIVDYATQTVMFSGAGEDITTIKRFGDDLNQVAKEKWQKVMIDISKLAQVYQDESGSNNPFTENYAREFRKYTSDPKNPQYQNVGEQFIRYYWNGGLGTIFNYDPKNFTEEHRNMINSTIDEIKSDLKVANDTQETLNILNTSETTFFDSAQYPDPASIPHDQVSNLLIEANYLTFTKSQGYIDSITKWLRNNPGKFNVQTINQALRNEQKFMDAVVAAWDDPNVQRSILEGDPVGTFKAAVITGSEKAADNIDDFLDSDYSPVKPLWDIFKDLWDNAGSYIEYGLIVGVLILLLWAGGEVKTIVS